MSARSLREQTLPRFALRREEAAASLSVSASTFDKWVADGRMPKGHKVDGLMLWDTEQVRDCWLAMRDGALVNNPLDDMVL
ncbi:hypothetical protein [Ancylobacter sp. G4_0304]|uniref:hypothetical protein n=1 Tax=Ancylobacter sp. G4_0304 TaxID=3114289 RepID=UPI0039C70A63